MRYRETEKGEGHEKMEADIGVMMSTSQGALSEYCWQPPEATRETRNRFFLRASGRNPFC